MNCGSNPSGRRYSRMPSHRWFGKVTHEFSFKKHPPSVRGTGVTACQDAYNPCMLHTLNALLGSAVMERVTLLANHVIGAEPVAMARLKGHAARSIRLHFDGWPSMLPPLPATVFRVTPAGLLEWVGQESGEGDTPDVSDAAAADLRVSIDASNPAQAVAQAFLGERPKVEVAGDAAFAADLNWLFDNLRWDMQDDLERIVGAAPAREIARLAGGVANGLRSAARAAGGLARRSRNAGWDAPAQ